MTNFSVYAIRSKKSKRFLKFEEWCDDGYGKYEDSISESYLKDGEFPSFFPEYVYQFNNLTEENEKKHILEVSDILKYLGYEVINHKNNDLEVVEFKIEFKE